MNVAHLFDEYLAYAMKRIGKDGLCVKDEQKQAIQDVYEGKDILCGSPQGMKSQYAMNAYRFCMYVWYEARSTPKWTRTECCFGYLPFGIPNVWPSL